MKRKHRLIYTSRSNKSLIDAFEYYEAKQLNLGRYFISSIEVTLQSINDHPEIYKAIYENYRQARVSGFPYVIIYRLRNSDEIVIENVFNTYQNPIKKL